MRAELPPAIVVTPDGEEVSSLDVQKGNHHRLCVETDSGSGDVALNFSTRRAMYDSLYHSFRRLYTEQVGSKSSIHSVSTGKGWS